ncbi:FAD-binding oxidoreductase [Microbacterium sp. HJ5]
MTDLSLTDLAAGTVVKPGDDDWDAARAFHSGVGEPTIIVRASTVDDVRAAVRYASSERLDVMVRGGGHSAWGAVPGGVTLDLDALDDIRVEGDLVHAGGGATWGAVAAVLAEHGLGVSSGDTASVGVGGLTLGGGIGWMVRAWGLAADQLVGAQVVTARGEVLEVDTESHPDLLWALRGGGGNFGVVTRFDFRAHPLTAVVFATLGVSGDARPVLRALRETMRDAPRELTVTYMDVPAMDPNAPAGATITACWIGDDEDAARAALAPLLALEGVSETELGVRSYPDILMDMPAADPDQPMPGFVGGNTLLEELTDDAVDRLASFREANQASVLFLRSLGGAFGDVPQGDTAFPARHATWFAMAGAFDVPGLVHDGNRPLIQAEWDAIEALGAALYGNFTVSTDPALVSRMYSPETIARLAEVKRRWDPQNLFCRNHNVRPA